MRQIAVKRKESIVGRISDMKERPERKVGIVEQGEHGDL